MKDLKGILSEVKSKNLTEKKIIEAKKEYYLVDKGDKIVAGPYSSEAKAKKDQKEDPEYKNTFVKSTESNSNSSTFQPSIKEEKKVGYVYMVLDKNMEPVILKGTPSDSRSAGLDTDNFDDVIKHARSKAPSSGVVVSITTNHIGIGRERNMDKNGYFDLKTGKKIGDIEDKKKIIQSLRGKELK